MNNSRNKPYKANHTRAMQKEHCTGLASLRSARWALTLCVKCNEKYLR